MVAVHGPADVTERVRPLGAGDPVRVGDFRLLGRLGAGGFGTVYLGRSAAGRLVAVKVVHADIARDQGFRARFGREVDVVRQVGGFYTAPLVAADATGDPPWLATAYVPGPSLAEIVATTGPLPEPALWWLAAGIAEALVAIHAAGVTHRDLKPGNVLVAPDGPRVIDFGIARTVDPAGITTSRVVIGTPAFLPPEQARDMRSAGPPADVYALGATLAYAGTGRPPHAGDDLVAVISRIVSGEPPDLDGLPASLTGLVRSCLSRDPGERPTPAAVLDAVRGHVDPGDLDPPVDVLPRTAVDLIEDHTAAVAALLDTRPGGARSWWVRRWRWAAVAGVAVVALVVPAAILGVPDLPGRDSGGSGASPSPSSSASATPRATDPDPVTAVTVTAAATTGTTAGKVREAPIAYAPDGDSLATGEISGTVWLRTPGTGVPLGAVPTHSGAVTALAFGPVGNLLAVLDEEGTLGMWDVTRLTRPERLWEQPVGRGTRLAFGPSGDLLALAGAGGTNLYTVTDSGVTEYAKLPTLPTQDPYPALAFSPDGRLANIGPGGELRVWDTTTGREVPGWSRRVPGPLFDAAFTPDGRLLITLEGIPGKDEGMRARVWDTATGRVLRTLPTPLGASSAKLAISPDGRLVATTAGPVFVGGTLWSVASGKELAKFRGSSGLIWGLAFAPDGRTLATAHGDGALRLWTLSVR